MGKFSIDRRKLKALIKKVWVAFRDAEALTDRNGNTIVVPGSIPILWFGNIDEYQVSSKRIVTVGTNPSWHEFRENSGLQGDLGLRFQNVGSFLNNEILEDRLKKDVDVYRATLNSYFGNNPYNWFNAFENVLRALNASYKGKMLGKFTPGQVKYNAVHIDLFTPAATFPIWSRLGDENKNALISYFEGTFKKMVGILDPDVLIFAGSFEKCRNLCDQIMETTIKLPPATKGYFAKPINIGSGKKQRLLIWGSNYRTPFGGVGYDVVRNDIVRIWKKWCSQR